LVQTKQKTIAQTNDVPNNQKSIVLTKHTAIVQTIEQQPLQSASTLCWKIGKHSTPTTLLSQKNKRKSETPL
jgi:DNA-binding FadR family transcriptional regulator